ncbi:MAG TPA: TIGR04282 family arsenosugar biosynthesis glycosyltransferase [Myxococcota bacterium]|nr:TIGR04282 family arsenosugar biosynthesis glycosyltransferase [Myxococcota bacterium]
MPRARGVLWIFAKQPAPGRVKTRMVPPLSPQQACDLYAEMLRDVLAASQRFARETRLEPILAVDPPAATCALARSAPPEFRVVPQRGANLAERMEWAIREAAAGGAERILLRGSDSPILDREQIEAALDALDEFDLAISPDLGSGYNLIGVRKPTPGLFDHAMSTRTVLSDTLANASARGLRAQLQRASFDLDTASDLGRLARERSGPRGASVTNLCPRTLSFLDAQQLWP